MDDRRLLQVGESCVNPLPDEAFSTKWETFQSKTEVSCHIQKTTLFENEIYVVTARLAPLRPTEKSETRGLTFKDKRVPVTTCDDDAPLNQC